MVEDNILEGKKYKIIDNFVSAENCQKIYEMLTHPYFPWYFSHSTLHMDDKTLDIRKDFYIGPQFGHSFVRDGESNSEYLKEILFLSNLNRVGLPIFRLKANNQLNNNETGTCHYPHLDNPTDGEKFINAVIYLHETDGDTVIFDDKIEKIKPLIGRAVFFDGLVWHGSNNPVKYKNRIILNINFNKINLIT
tara:strand:+ start:425 stop:1000 length:576 start_codon:yes stop_codon:yes gene_type:complete